MLGEMAGCLLLFYIMSYEREWCTFVPLPGIGEVAELLCLNMVPVVSIQAILSSAIC